MIVLNKPWFKRVRLAVGVLAVIISITFALWLVLYLLGYPVDIVHGDRPLSFTEMVRLLAEVVVGGLLLAALAFL